MIDLIEEAFFLIKVYLICLLISLLVYLFCFVFDVCSSRPLWCPSYSFSTFLQPEFNVSQPNTPFKWSRVIYTDCKFATYNLILHVVASGAWHSSPVLDCQEYKSSFLVIFVMLFRNRTFEFRFVERNKYLPFHELKGTILSYILKAYKTIPWIFENKSMDFVRKIQMRDFNEFKVTCWYSHDY